MREKTKTKEQLVRDFIEQGIIESIGDAVSIQDTNFKILYQNQSHIEPTHKLKINSSE